MSPSGRNRDTSICRNARPEPTVFSRVRFPFQANSIWASARERRSIFPFLRQFHSNTRSIIEERRPAPLPVRSMSTLKVILLLSQQESLKKPLPSSRRKILSPVSRDESAPGPVKGPAGGKTSMNRLPSMPSSDSSQTVTGMEKPTFLSLRKTERTWPLLDQVLQVFLQPMT